MELKQLETLYWVSKLGSFSSAANHLHTTQPAVSARIQSLENELGVTLFDRTTRQVTLTRRGQEIIGHAEQITRYIDRIRKSQDRTEELTGTIRIGATNTVAHSWLPELIRRTNLSLPRVDVDFEVDTMAALSSRFAARDVDVLISNAAMSGARVVTRPLYKTSFDFVAHREMDFGAAPIPIKRLALERVITFSKGTSLFDTVRQHFSEAGAGKVRVNGCNSVSAMMLMTKERLCVGAFLRDAIPPEFAGDLQVLEVDRPLPGIEFFLSYLADPFATIAPAIADIADEICRERAREI